MGVFLCGSMEAADPSPGTGSGSPLNIVVPASAGPRNPVTVTSVKTGQKVTITAGKVLWKGGGSKGTAFTDWHGYKDRLEKNGLPWMALVAAVGKKTFVASSKEFSFTAPSDGDLVLFANDSNPKGNSGKGEVTVTINSGG